MRTQLGSKLHWSFNHVTRRSWIYCSFLKLVGYIAYVHHVIYVFFMRLWNLQALKILILAFFWASRSNKCLYSVKRMLPNTRGVPSPFGSASALFHLVHIWSFSQTMKVRSIPPRSPKSIFFGGRIERYAILPYCPDLGK